MKKLSIFFVAFLLIILAMEFTLYLGAGSWIKGESMKDFAIAGVILIVMFGNSRAGKPIIGRGPVTVPAILFMFN